MSFANATGGIREEGKERNQNDHYPTPPFATHAKWMSSMSADQLSFMKKKIDDAAVQPNDAPDRLAGILSEG